MADNADRAMTISQAEPDAHAHSDTLARLDAKLQTETLGLIARSIAGGILGVYVNDKNYPLYFINEGMLEYVGFSREDFVREYGNNVLDLIHPDDREEVRAMLEQGLLDKKEYQCRFRVLKKDGGFLWMFNRGRRSSSEGERDVLLGVFLDISELVQAQQELRDQARALSISREQFRIAFANTNRLMAIYDVPGRTLTQPKETAALLGVPEVVTDMPESLLDKPFLLPESRSEYRDFYLSMNMGVPEGEGCFHLAGSDGHNHWISARYSLIFDEQGQPGSSVISYEDITERREKELAYEKWRRYFELQRPGCIDYYEYNLTRNCFSASKNISSLGVAETRLPEDALTFTGAVQYFAENIVYPPDRAAYLAFYQPERLLLCYGQGNAEECLEYRRMRDGAPFWVKSSVKMIPDPDTGDLKAFLLVQDIDEEKRELISIRERIEHDSLTGLLNRTAMTERVERLQRCGGSHLFAMLDIDYFKHLNDTFGHQFGDMVLKDTAAIMHGFIRENDLCGRLGGDEFVIFLCGIPSHAVAERALKRLCTLLKKTYDTGATISISVGAVYPCVGMPFEALYTKADQALYRAKGQGRNQFVLAVD